jgi:hypothetical protein
LTTPETTNAFYDGFLAHLKARFPETSSTFSIAERLSPNLVSPHKVKLPTSLKTQALKIVEAFHALRNDRDRDARLSSLAPVTPNPGNDSVLMSYDFHVDEKGDLRLIEINTNASLSLIVNSLYRYQNVTNTFSQDFETEIMESFEREFSESRASENGKLEHVAIVDEKPSEQRLFVEFKFYQELFRKRGYNAMIVDAAEFEYDGSLRLESKKVDLVYNRHTDFYFETPACQALRSAFVDESACISPNPHEYRLLADKARLLELSTPGNSDLARLTPEQRATIQKTLIPTVEITSLGGPEEMWKERKRFFFKPKRMFGGKAVYKGASITRSTFNGVYSENYLAQEHVPAGKLQLGNEEFKFDLRFFVYRDRIQLACARVYRGQMTNVNTPGGGSAAIEWT